MNLQRALITGHGNQQKLAILLLCLHCENKPLIYSNGLKSCNFLSLYNFISFKSFPRHTACSANNVREFACDEKLYFEFGT